MTTAKIKRYDIPVGTYLYTEPAGKILLASDIDVGALEAAIESLGVEQMALETAALNSIEPHVCDTLNKHAEKNKQYITHLTALVEALK